MTKETNVYHVINREEWRSYRDTLYPKLNVSLTEDQLEALISLNDDLTLTDAIEIYYPITQLLSIYYKNYHQLMTDRNRFLGIKEKISPFIIGISGSVAVGKSTIARLLQLFLSQVHPNLNVDLITTDGFLFPNEILEERGLMNRKGFPESYDMQLLRDFLIDVKNNKRNLKSPKYSHQIYNIVPNEWDVLQEPHILIVEGINILQITPNHEFFMGEFPDVSLYVDADSDLIEEWFMQRFDLLVENAKANINDYYHSYGNLSLAERHRRAHKIWTDINLLNLKEYILPTRNRADIVIHKEKNHYVDAIWMKKY